MKKYLLCCLLLFPGFGQLIAQTAQLLTVREFCRQQQHAIIDEFVSFLSIPNIAADTLNIRNNALFLMEMMKKRGIGQVQLLSPVTAGAAPVVYGEVKIPGASHTIIFYAHYDGQPVNPAQWAPGLEPFKPRLANGTLEKQASLISFPQNGSAFDPDWRIYARGASDDKAGVIAILNAYDAIARSGLPLQYNLKFFFEGEEEAGSVHLSEVLEKYKSLLSSDVWVICDGPVHQSGLKQVVFGVRGDTHLELTVYASKRPLHSGHYGNWAPNPAMMLARVLASMKDDDGQILIKDFYNDVIPFTLLEEKALKEIPSVEEQMKKELGIARVEMTGKSLNESINLPSLNINGMQSGNTGKMASNVIPVSATADLDLRLVLGNDWQRQQQKVISHIQMQGYHVIDHEPTDEERTKFDRLAKVTSGSEGYNAQRTPMDLPIAKKVVDAVQSTTTDPVVRVPSLGGSLPLFLFEKYLAGKTIIVPINNHDNNQHAENENIRLRNLWSGIETMAALMMMKP